MTVNAWDLAGLTRAQWLGQGLDQRLRLAAGPYIDGWGYDLRDARVLYDLPDAMRADRIEISAGEPRLTNCSTLTTSLLTSVYPDAPWTLQEYGDLQVFADRLPAHPASPIEAVERMGVGRATVDPAPGCWHLVQGWRTFDPQTPRYSGHAFLVLADGNGDGVQVLEATSRRGIGPRYRSATWADLRDEYPAGLYIAALHG